MLVRLRKTDKYPTKVTLVSEENVWAVQDLSPKLVDIDIGGIVVPGIRFQIAEIAGVHEIDVPLSVVKNEVVKLDKLPLPQYEHELKILKQGLALAEPSAK